MRDRVNPPWWLALLGYELKILRRGNVWFVLISLFLVSLVLIFGSSRSPSYGISVVFFENVAPLVMLFLATTLLSNDRDHGTIERMFASPGHRSTVYLRRFATVCGVDVAILSALILLWQLDPSAISVPRALMTSIPPALFLSGLAFLGALLVRDPNVGAIISAGWWVLNQFAVKYGNTGWFGYIFLFKETYYPGSSTLVGNRLTLLLLGVTFLSLIPLLLRKAERYL